MIPDFSKTNELIPHYLKMKHYYTIFKKFKMENIPIISFFFFWISFINFLFFNNFHSISLLLFCSSIFILFPFFYIIVKISYHFSFFNFCNLYSENLLNPFNQIKCFNTIFIHVKRIIFYQNEYNNINLSITLFLHKEISENKLSSLFLFYDNYKFINNKFFLNLQKHLFNNQIFINATLLNHLFYLRNKEVYSFIFYCLRNNYRYPETFIINIQSLQKSFYDNFEYFFMTANQKYFDYKDDYYIHFILENFDYDIAGFYQKLLNLKNEYSLDKSSFGLYSEIILELEQKFLSKQLQMF